jgi:hypothetical protein
LNTVLTKLLSSPSKRGLLLGGLVLALAAVLFSVLQRRDDDARPAMGGNFATCAKLKGDAARDCYNREVTRELASVGGGSAPSIALSAPADSGGVTFTSSEATQPLLCDLHARVGVIDDQVPSWLGWTESLAAKS